MQFPSLASAKMISVDTETYDPELATKGPSYHRGGFIAGIAVATDQFKGYYPIAHEPGNNLEKRKVLNWLKGELAGKQPKVFAHAAYDLGFLACAGIKVNGPIYDVQIAEPLLDEGRKSYSLEALAQDYLGQGKQTSIMEAWIIENFGQRNIASNIWRTPPEFVAPYAVADAELTLKIFKKQQPELVRQELWDLFLLESRLIPMLVAMRLRGVRVDLAAAERLYEQMSARQTKLLKKVGNVAPWNARAIAKLFDKAGVDYPRTPKTNAPSFTKEWLAACPHPVARTVHEIRHLDKLRETFVKGVVLDGHYRGRLHCSFNQLRSDNSGTVSGRFSCVAAWTPIITKRGIVPIQQVRVGDWVFTHKCRWRRIVAYWLKGQEQMFNVYLSNGQILTCTGAHRVYIAKLDQQSQKYSSGFTSVPQNEYLRTGKAPEYNISQCFRCIAEFLDQNGKTCATFLPSITWQEGQEKSDVWEKFRKASQLERSNQWQRGLPNHQDQEWSNSLQPLHSTELETLSHSSHRRQSKKQSCQQSSDLYSARTPNYSRIAEDQSTLVTIEKIEAAGIHYVYDISVEEDESYLACGIFSHNSSNPNLQQIPMRTEDGEVIRTLFLPDQGQDLGAADFSQIEFRIIAATAADLGFRGADAFVEAYKSDPNTDFHAVVAQMTGLPRLQAKTITFAAAYGAGINRIALALGLDLEAGRRVLDEYHRRATFMRPLSRYFAEQAEAKGQIETVLGRVRRFPLWETRRGDEPPSYSRQRTPGAQRAFTHRALNAFVQGSAADVLKQAMALIWENGVCSVLGAPHLTVHDELVVSVPKTKQGREAFREMVATMEKAIEFSIAMKVDAGLGKNWKDAKDAH